MYFTVIKLLDSNHVYMLKLLTCFISYLLYLLYGFMERNKIPISISISILIQMTRDIWMAWKEYWLTMKQLLTHVYSKTMRCDRLLHILWFLHLSIGDNATAKMTKPTAKTCISHAERHTLKLLHQFRTSGCWWNGLFWREEHFKNTSPRNINVLEWIFTNYGTCLATYKTWTCTCMTTHMQTADDSNTCNNETGTSA